MNRRALLCLLAASTISGCAGVRTKNPIEGTWTISSATLAGNALPITAFQDAKLRLDAGNYEFGIDRGDYVVLPDTTPAAIDTHGRDGPNAGKTILAIYDLKGEMLTVCYDLSGKARPTAFASLPGTQLFLVRYRRIPD